MRTERDALLSLQAFFAATFPDRKVRRALKVGADPDRPFVLIESIDNGSMSGPPNGQTVTLPVSVTLFLEQQTTPQAADDLALETREQIVQAVKFGPNARRLTTDRIPLWAWEPRVEVHRVAVSGALDGTWTLSIGDGTPTDPLEVDITANELAAAVLATLDTDPENPLPDGSVIGVERGTGLWDLQYVGPLAGQRVGEPEIETSDLQGLRATGSAIALLHGAVAPWRSDSDWMRVESFSARTLHDEADPTLAVVAVDMRLTFARGARLPWDYRVLQRLQ